MAEDAISDHVDFSAQRAHCSVEGPTMQVSSRFNQ